MDSLDRLMIISAVTPEQLQMAYAIRRAVFIEEQRVPEEIELDAEDRRALHVLALDGAEAVGCGRMIEHDEYVKIGRMAVKRERRGKGIGRAILAYLIAAAQARGYRKAVLHAQLHAENFYLGNGFTPVGEVFEEAGIAHRRMERRL